MIHAKIKYWAFASFLFWTSVVLCQEKINVPSDFRNNIIKINLLPIPSLINGNNQKWFGMEYERFLNKKISLGAMANFGLFEDYSFIQYNDYFDEYSGYSYIEQDFRTWGFHFIPTFKYYFLITKSKKGQGFYVGGNIDFNYYLRNTSTYASITNENEYDKLSTTRFALGGLLGGQYIAFSRLVIDANMNFFGSLFSINGGEINQEIKPLNATWVSENNNFWLTFNVMIGYSFGGGKRK